MVILSVDYGDARTGVAYTSGNGFVFPIETIKSTDRKYVINRICEISKQKKAEKIVVGMPSNMDGSKGERAEACESFGKKLTKLSELPVEYFDERLTTMLAERYLSETKTFKTKRKDVLDSESAVIILEDYLKLNTKNK
ncbi:MAG: Holliday junction resolvase RuvX [Candidatus Fimenecus sp.]